MGSLGWGSVLSPANMSKQVQERGCFVLRDFSQATEVVPRVNGSLERVRVLEVVRDGSRSPRGAWALISTFLLRGERSRELIKGKNRGPG